MSEAIVLAGGNGYIGGAVAHLLRESGIEPVILDNFSTSEAGALDPFNVLKVNLADARECRQALESLGPIGAVFHFAAHALVGESWEEPGLYYRNNLNASLNLAECAASLKIPHFIHSSSCTVYGVPKTVPITEEAGRAPISPYGDTKLFSESILERLLRTGTRVLNLRYFNPAGAMERFQWGEAHEPETHLIPRTVSAALEHRPISIFGQKYPTPDGTCIRDFIHIEDLAQAHLLSLKALRAADSLPPALNIGRGTGHSVLEVVKTAEKIAGKTVSIDWQPPRAGDPPALVADTTLMKQRLQWTPSRDLAAIVNDDWNFRRGRLK